MSHLTQCKIKELQGYFKGVVEEYPSFIEPYLNTAAFSRLKGIGQFCGCDYSNLFQCKFWYSRLDHSVICALMTWHFTKDKKQTLGALFHDLGTPAFSHCVDFLLHDAEEQNSSEKSVEDIIRNHPDILALLEEDHITVEEVVEIARYPIVENKNPKICVDRLDGILHTVFIWLGTWTLEEVLEVYRDIVVLYNEDGEEELGFQTLSIAEKFFEAVFQYSIVLQQQEDIFVGEFVAYCLRELLEQKVILLDDLYCLSEKQVIKFILENPSLQSRWKAFTELTHLERISKKEETSLKVKKRYVVPLVQMNGQCARLNKVSKTVQEKVEQYLEYQDTPYIKPVFMEESYEKDATN